MATKKAPAKKKPEKAPEEVQEFQNFKIKSIAIRNTDEVDDAGHKYFRTVYAAQEVEALYVDTEWINKQYEREAWEAHVVVGLFRASEESSENLLQKEDTILISEELDVLGYKFLFRAEELKEKKFTEGIYVVVMNVNGINVQSDHIFLMEGDGNPDSYLKIVKAGIDAVKEESEEEAKVREHSFSCLDIRTLKDVRFYLMAENLLEQEWVYEFMIVLSHRNGMVKAVRVIRGNQYMENSNGKHILFAATDLAEGIADFWKKGEYVVKVLAFDRLLFSLDFNIGEKEFPYEYTAEIAAGANGTMLRNPFMCVDGEQMKGSVLDKLYKLVGLRKVKEEITRISEYAEFIQMRRNNGFNDEFPPMHMLFTGNPGTGKNTIAGIVGELFYSMGVLSNGRLSTYTRNELTVSPGTEEAFVRKMLAAHAGGVLFIDNVSDFYDPAQPQGGVLLANLVNLLMREEPEVIVILADGTEEMNMLTAAYPELRQCFPKQFVFDDYAPEELMEIAKNKLAARQFRFTPAAEEKFLKLLKTSCADKGQLFTNGYFIDEKLNDMVEKMAKRIMNERSGKLEKEEMMLVQPVDIQVAHAVAPEASFEKLEAIVGEKQLKQSLVKHLNYVYFIRERQKQGFDDTMPPLNMIFSGNPGTGKHTVAKMLSEIYYSAGILPSLNVVVQSAYALAGGNNVVPEQVVGSLLDMAHGGILYLENATVLLKTAQGMAVLETLLSTLSVEEFEQLIIIFGDTAAEIDAMLQAVPGLKIYFPYRFDFQDHTPEELLDIAVQKLKERNYSIHPKAKTALKELIQKQYAKRDEHFGNSIWIDKLVNAGIQKMSDRTMKIRQQRELTRQELTTIMLADIPVDEVKRMEFSKDHFDEKEIKDTLKELDKIVGQQKIKKQIYDFVSLARHYNKQGVKLSSKMSLQWCFTGNSGMGKKAVARIIARIYKAMGIIDKATVNNFKAEQLIGLTEEEAFRLLGETLLKSSGGILLFDEETKKMPYIEGFRERVRAILANQMAERPGSYMVIYAGPRLVPQNLNGDVEKVSDIINVLQFENYSNEELMLILKRKLIDEQMKLTTTARQHMENYISLLNSTEERRRSSARLMRITAELMIQNCIQRLAKHPKADEAAESRMISVSKSDVLMFNEEFIVNLSNERKKIGFV